MQQQSVTFLEWLTVIGLVLLVMALGSSYLRRLPVSTSAIYLGLGYLLGPVGFAWLELDLGRATPWFERATEIAVVMSLFTSGLKLRLPLGAPAWSAAFRLAFPVMVLTICGIAVLAHVALGVDFAHALLLGAILAPTDPVLASAVAVQEAADDDRMRYGLSGEAGLNDGMAFPFVVLGLEWARHGGPGTWLLGWAAHRLLWAVPVALVIGFVLGQHVGRLSIYLRTRHHDTSAPSDLLSLALIALSYVAAEEVGAWGFLSVFAAGFGLRRAELAVVQAAPHDSIGDLAEPVSKEAPDVPPDERLVPAHVRGDELEEPAVAAGVLVAEAISFGDTAERLIEVALVALVGISTRRHWDAHAPLIAFVLFFVIRPLVTQLSLRRTPTTSAQRWLMGWFGIRGIGSLYYLSYALNHGISGPDADLVVDLTVSVVALSIIVHGVSATPLLSRYERAVAAHG